MKELPENASVEEQCDYYKELSVDFAIQYVKACDNYEADITMLMFMISEYIPFFESMLCDLGMEDVLNKFKEKRSLKNAAKDYDVPTFGGEL